MDTLADDLATVIARTGVQDAALVGFSMGGGEVARYMSRHGGKSVARAILVSSVLPYRLKTRDNPVGTSLNPVSEEGLDWAWGIAMHASLKATLECAKSFSSTDFRGDLQAFKVPTLIIHGTEDRLSADLAEFLAR